MIFVNEMTDDGMDHAVDQIDDQWNLLIIWAAIQGTTRVDDPCLSSELHATS